MKKLKILACGSLLLCSGLMFAGCGDDLETFDASKITVGDQSVVYNGQEQIFSVAGYDGATVTYSKDNKQTFVSASELDLTNAGTYTIYYKLSKNGYEDYISSAQTFTITEREITVSISTITDFIENAKTAQDIVDNVIKSYQGSVVTGDILNIDYTVENYTQANAEAGDVYTISGVDNDDNYDITINSGSYKLIDTVSIGTKHYSSIESAIADAQDGDVIKLNRDCELSSQLIIDNAITIDGQGHSIKATSNFDTTIVQGKTSMVGINSNKTVTFKDVTLDANSKVRVLHASDGKVVIDGATITNGLSANYIGGVYITGAAEFEMTSGTIANNSCAEDYADDNYLQYSSDLWIGSEASGKLSSISGGTIGSVFVNANASSTQGSGFEIDGGTIENVYVEYANGNGANFTFTSGDVTNLYVSTLMAGESAKVSPVEGTEYKGGILATAKTSANVVLAFTDINAAVAHKQTNPTDYFTAYLAGANTLTQTIPLVDEVVLIDDVVLSDDLVITKTLTLNLNGKTIYNTTEIWSKEDKEWSLISVQAGGDLTITGDGYVEAKENDCFAVDVRDGATLTIDGGNFVGNISAVYVHSGTATINGGTFSIQQLSDYQDGYDQVVNCYNDNYANDTANIILKGGRFVKYNPEGYPSEGNFVADGYTVTSRVEETVTVYTVVEE